jgi:hypothetical protein
MFASKATTRWRAIARAAMVGAACLLATQALAQMDEAPFEWNPAFASPGTSLSIDSQVMRGPPNGMVVVAIKATGFSDAAATLALWERRGGRYYKHKPAVDANGMVQLIPGVDATMLGGYIRGQSFDVALVDEATTQRAHAKITPFPISAEAAGGCKASAEVLTESGLVWLISLAGYSAGEQIGVTSVAKKETLTKDIAASESGQVAFPILYPKGSKGGAKITAKGSHGCDVSLEFAIGESALKAK